MTEQSSQSRYTLRYGLDTGPISTEPYVSAECFERDRERIYKRVWLNVGRLEELPNFGDFGRVCQLVEK